MSPRRVAIERNIDIFHSRFQFEEDQNVRDVLLSLLIKEEDKLGSAREKMEILDRKIARGLILIEKQNDIIDAIKIKKLDTAVAARILELLTDSQNALKAFKAAITPTGMSPAEDE
ncbi:hypothetical protein AB4Z01_19300 [Inquilinus sp. YAF38]|uniref:hypothetical protein n=1 Tax=Inquilinus sp. YAF38 TaxID=3233084 RepID=UPI003F91A476